MYYCRPLIPNDGGISVISLTLSSLLEKAGHVVYSIAKESSINKMYLEKQYVLPATPANDRSNVCFLSEFIICHKIDIVINQQPIDDVAEDLWSMVRKKTGVKVVACLHNPVTRSAINYHLTKEYFLKKKWFGLPFLILSNPLSRIFLKRLYILKNRNRYLKIVNNSDLVLTLCDGMSEELFDMIGIKNHNKVRVLPNFLSNIPDFIPGTAKDNAIVWCGQVNFDVKRVDVIITLWQSLSKVLSNYKLYILGDGPELNNAKKMAQDLNLSNIIFTGRVSPQEYYTKAKFVIVTSSYESFSLVTLESMAYSCIPIVFNTFPAASYIIQGNEGILIKPYDLTAAQYSIVSLANDMDCYGNITPKAYKRALEFSENEIFERWSSILKELS